MSNFERVFYKGEELHPMVNKEFFTIPIAIDMEGLNKTLFGLDDYSKFLRKIRTEESFKKRSFKTWKIFMEYAEGKISARLISF